MGLLFLGSSLPAGSDPSAQSWGWVHSSHLHLRRSVGSLRPSFTQHLLTEALPLPARIQTPGHSTE